MSKRKKRRGLRSPKFTKRLLGWAIHKNSRAAYIGVLIWPRVLVVPLAVYGALKIPPSSVGPWLYRSKTILAVVLSVMYVIDAALPGVRSWGRRRGAQFPNITPPASGES